ncbi:helix-turn-helix transcriptional regulator [Sphingomonas sp. PP-CE-1G-424]|uniref:XRE family transcriptional regulator n=1 Tax=Sphingomonas sp. PP-CE-1G-424 TaxID=2135658 RepID=UPI0010ED83CA|nr:helix-turn-helix transcriptional regulator [Sphingomonas sp. PP-CE-1G-424]TCP71845.1 phage repressor protein C with HTH and peptisase S24 domain [Sphingomonas sp. PP-CE-1G-424]
MDKSWFDVQKKTAGVGNKELADAIGRDRSIVSRILKGEVRFDLDYADPFARVLGVDAAEILLRAGAPIDVVPPSNARAVAFEGASLENPAGNLPVWGTGLGAAREIDGEAIEQTDLNTGEVLEYVKRPSILKGKQGAYGLHVQGSSMHPALPDGEMVAACRDMPLAVGDNVVVYLRMSNDDDDGAVARAVLIKELVRRSASFLELRQYEPKMDFRIPMSSVLRIDRILTRREMLM